MARASFRYNGGDERKKLDFDQSFSPLSNGGELKTQFQSTPLPQKSSSSTYESWFFIFGAAVLLICVLYTWLNYADLDLYVASTAAISFISGVFQRISRAVLLSVAVGIFTWMVTFYDSRQPGIDPPTPLSPRRCNEFGEESKQYFQFNYAIAILNAITFFILSLSGSWA